VPGKLGTGRQRQRQKNWKKRLLQSYQQRTNTDTSLEGLGQKRRKLVAEDGVREQEYGAKGLQRSRGPGGNCKRPL